MAKDLSWDELSTTNPTELSWDSLSVEPPKPKSRTWGDVAGDIGVTALKGAIGLPQALVGLADFPTGGIVGKTLEDIGYRPNEASKQLDDLYSDPQKAANRKVAEAEGFTGTLAAHLQNPSTIATTVGESVPQILGGAGVARGLMKAFPKVAAWAAGALGEGIMGAGSAEEQTRAESADGLTTAKQGMAALASGAGTAAFGMAGGKLAGSKLGQRLGLADVDTMLASGKFTPSTAGFFKAVAGSGISEGVLEEMPQSAWEQMLQNYAQEKPLTEGMGKAMASGLVAGAAMGGAGGGFNAAMAPKPANPAVPPVAPPADPLQLGNTPDPMISFPDGTVARRSEVDQYIANLPEDQQVAARAKLSGFAPQKATIADIGAAPNMDDAIAAFTQVVSAPVDLAPDISDAQEFADLVQSETRNQQVMLAQMDQERIKQAQLDQIPAIAAEQNVTQEALQRAAALDAPTAMGSAFSKLFDKTIGAEPEARETAPAPVPAPKPVPEPRIVARDPGMLAMPRELAELRATMNGGEVVRFANINKDTGAPNGKFAYTVLEDGSKPSLARVANAAPPASVVDQRLTPVSKRTESTNEKAPEAIEASPPAQTSQAEVIEPNFEAAKALIKQQKAATGNKSKENLVRIKLRQLAAKTPINHGKTVSALDIAATRLGMGEGKLKGLEFAPEEQPQAPVEPAQVATETVAKPRKKPAGGKTLRSKAYDKNPLLTFLATHGLFHDKTKPGSHKVEFSPDKAIMVMGYGPVFKKTGKRLDELTQNAIEEGYLPTDGTESQLRELVRRAVAGEKISPLYAEGVAEQIAEQNFAEHLAQQQEAAQNEDFDDPFGPMLDGDFVADDFDVPGYDEASDPIKLEVNALLALADDAGINEDAREAIKEDAHYATLDQSEQAYYEAYRNALKAAIAASNRVGSADSGEASNAQGQREASPPEISGSVSAVQSSQKALEAGRAEIDEAKGLKYKLPYLEDRLKENLDPTDGFDMHILANELPPNRAYNRMMTDHNGDFSGVEFKNKDGRHAFVLPDASQPGKWRVSYFDKDGFSRHESEPTREKAQQSLARDGYTIEDRGALDRLASTKEWARGTDFAGLIFQLNSGAITHAQFIEKQNKLNADYEASKGEGLTLTAPSRQDVLAQQAAIDAEAKRKEEGGDKPIPRKQLTGDIPDLFNPQGSVFDAPAEPEAVVDPISQSVQALADAVKGLQTALAPKVEEDAAEVRLTELLQAPTKSTGKPAVAFGTQREENEFKRGYRFAIGGGVKTEQQPGVPAKEQKYHDAFANGFAYGARFLDAKPDKERIDALKDVKKGDITPDELKAAYPAKEPAAKIEDAGAKIGGARKDRWKERGLDLNDLDSMSESEGAEMATKANVWKPDYEAMAEAAEPVTAAMVKTVYDQLAAKPKTNTPEGRRNYVTMMQAVRKAYLDAKSPDDVKNAGQKIKAEIGLYSADQVVKAKAREVLFSVYKGRSDPFILSYNELSKAKKMVEDGFPAKGEPWKKRLSIRQESGYGGSERGIEILMRNAAEAGTPLTREEVIAPFWRVSDKNGKALAYLSTKADAEAAAKSIYERDMKGKDAEKPEPKRPHLDDLTRENLAQRIDRDVTANDFVSDFGFRGIEFGNWAAQDERQRIINMAYDGLMDLAEIMGVPPKAMSLNGTLGMAFGARGGGKFAAHYEPGKLVINMTKLQGGGSMAHEFAHALDHYFGELNKPDAYTTAARGASGWYTEDAYKGVPRTRMEKIEGKWANVTKMRLDNLRPEMAAAFDNVMSALFSGQETKAEMVRAEELRLERNQTLADRETDPQMKAVYLRGVESQKQQLEELRKDPEDKLYPKGRSKYAGQAQALSGKSASGYWLRPTEMFARAFESWVFDKVVAMGARSDYLVHGVEEDRFAGGEYKGNPYPTGEERANINAAFDRLASTIQTKETDKGVAMFALGADAFRLGITPRKFMPVADVQKAVDQLAAKWTDGPKIKVVTSPDELPVDAPSDARGLIYKGTAYIVAGNHLDRAGVARTLAHEAIGHYGLWKMLGKDGTKQFERTLQMALKAGNKPLKAIAAQVRALYVDDSGKFNLSPAEEANEIAAFAVENAIDADGNFKPGLGFLKSVFAKVVAFLRSKGFTIEFTNAELQGMLVSSMRGLEAGKRLEGGGESLVAASRGENEDSGGADQNKLAKAWMGVASDTGIFRYGTSERTTVNGVFADVAPDFIIENSGGDKDYADTWTFYAKDKDGGKIESKKGYVLVYKDGRVELNVLKLGTGNLGSQAYSAVGNWAHNTGHIFAADRMGASTVGITRRLENMISLALKFGSTDFMLPSDALNLDWIEGDTEHNLDQMLRASYADISTKLPEIENARYDFDTGRFSPDVTQKLIERARLTGIQGGEGTVKRGIVTGSILRVIQSGEAGRYAGGNRGALDGIAYARGGIVGQTSPHSWDAPEASRFDDLVYKLQDKQIDTKRVIEEIRNTGKALADEKDVYLQEELFHGRAAARTEDFLNKELAPLIAEMKMRGIDIATLDEYLHARHAEEANALIADRNPDIQDGGSGMTNKAARDYFGKLPADERKRLEAVVAKVDAMLGKTRQMYADYGLESDATVKGWGDMFKHYVPLMREHKDGGMGIGQGFSIKGKETKGRTGSTRKVVDILANIAMQRERAIVRGEKNRVATALVGLVVSNPNPDFWQVGPPPMEKVYDPKTNSVVERQDPLYKSRDNVVVAKVKNPDGTVKEVGVVFNEDNDRALRMATSLKNLDATKMEGMLGVSAKISRYFAAINTQYNPIFGVVNLVRDFQGALLNLDTTALKDHKTEVASHALSALKGIYLDARAARDGKPQSSAWAALWEEFQDEGGQTGYRDMFANSSDRAKAIEHELNPTKWMDSPLGKIFTANGMLKVPLSVAQEKASGLFGWLSDYNLAMENAVRLSAYKVGLEQGMSKQQAASLGKNLTVNFNRKGQAGQQAGALYAFFNASMQGTARIGKTLFDMDGSDVKSIRLSSFGKKVVYGGMTLGVMQALLLAAAGFDDEEPPDFVRERSLVIPTGGKSYITIPMPLGLHIIPNMGRIPTEFALGGFKKPAQHIAKLMGLTMDAFNPIGGGASLVQTLSFTATDPLVALAENKDWTGKPIAKTSYNKATPGHALMKDTASYPSKLLAEAINTMTGGTKYTAGVLSPTPDQIDYLWGQATGGVGRELSKAQQSASATLSGEDLPIHKVPLVGRFYGNADTQSAQSSKFYSTINRLNENEAEIKGLRKDGKLEELREYLADNPEAPMYRMAGKVELEVQKLRRMKREMMALNAPPERIKAIEARITAIMTQFNQSIEQFKARRETATAQ